MNDETKRKRPSKPPKSTRRFPPSASRTNKTTRQISPQLPLTTDPSTQTTEPDFLNIITGGIDPDINDPPVLRLPNVPMRKSSKKKGKSHRSDFQSSTVSSQRSDNYDFPSQSISIGNQRREELIQCMKSFYQNYFEFDQNSTLNSVHDYLLNSEKRKQYSTDLW